MSAQPIDPTPAPTPEAEGTDAAKFTKPYRQLVAFVLLAVVALFLLLALADLVLVVDGWADQFTSRSNLLFGSFVSIETIGLPVLAVLLATHYRPLVSKARTITVLALVEYCVAAVFGLLTAFAAFIGTLSRTDTVDDNDAIRNAAERLLTRFGGLALLAVALLVVFRVYQGMFSAPKPVAPYGYQAGYPQPYGQPGYPQAYGQPGYPQPGYPAQPAVGQPGAVPVPGAVPAPTAAPGVAPQQGYPAPGYGYGPGQPGSPASQPGQPAYPAGYPAGGYPAAGYPGAQPQGYGAPAAQPAQPAQQVQPAAESASSPFVSYAPPASTPASAPPASTAPASAPPAHVAPASAPPVSAAPASGPGGYGDETTRYVPEAPTQFVPAEETRPEDENGDRTQLLPPGAQPPAPRWTPPQQ